MKCKNCNCEINAFDIGTVKRVCDVGSERIGLFCLQCGEKVEAELKKKRFVETYKEQDIYFKEGGYYPYYESLYFYKEIEGARSRIDNPHIAVISI